MNVIWENYVDETNFSLERTASHFWYDLKFKTAISRIHFAICEVQSNNLNTNSGPYVNLGIFRILVYSEPWHIEN